MTNSRRKNNLITWNRKIHIYLGLFLLFFIWLFGLSGILLNHHWEFSDSWPKRKVISYEQTIKISDERDKHTLALEIMNKLDLNGGIVNLRYSADSAMLDFILTKPGTRYDFSTELSTGKLMIKETKLDQWAALRALHTMRNPTQKELDERYRPVLAFLWSLSIDVVSGGLILICMGGWYLRFQASKRRFYLGLISLITGFILASYILMF